jgi:hypothetical protein
MKSAIFNHDKNYDKQEWEVIFLGLLGFGCVQLVFLIIYPLLFNKITGITLLRLELISVSYYALTIGFYVRLLFKDKPFWNVVLRFSIAVVGFSFFMSLSHLAGIL